MILSSIAISFKQNLHRKLVAQAHATDARIRGRCAISPCRGLPLVVRRLDGTPVGFVTPVRQDARLPRHQRKVCMAQYLLVHVSQCIFSAESGSDIVSQVGSRGNSQPAAKKSRPSPATPAVANNRPQATPAVANSRPASASYGKCPFFIYKQKVNGCVPR